MSNGLLPLVLLHQWFFMRQLHMDLRARFPVEIYGKWLLLRISIKICGSTYESAPSVKLFRSAATLARSGPKKIMLNCTII